MINLLHISTGPESWEYKIVTMLSVHQKINAKANMLTFQGYNRHPLIKRLIKRCYEGTEKFLPDELIDRNAYYNVRYPKRDESVPSDWWSGGIADNH